MADDLKKVAQAAESAGKAARIAHQEATAAANTAQSAGEAAKVAHDEATKAANAAQSAGKAAKELKVVTDDHEERISAIEDHLESQPVTSSAPSPVTQPATTAAPAATTSLVVPQLRTDGNIPDLPDPVIMVTEGGVAIDRVKRTWLNINQLKEDERDLDVTSESNTPIRQASIPQRRPEPLHRTPTRAEIEEEDRRQREAREDRRNQEESRRLPNRFDSDDPFSEPYDEIKPSHQDLVQTPQSRSDFPTLIQRSAEKKEKPEKKEIVIDTKKSIIIGLVLLLMAIASLIWVANRPTPVSQTTPTTTQYINPRL